ncbi:MAG: sigma 54-interacting transcriptional regulator [Bacillota bacterium]|nr:sigma 54-interacting transcriptional regulator [Bacillota bacterium]MDI7249067.1 sigma 54-interacting transcriptional regulator [Bacillota bacterium]
MARILVASPWRYLTRIVRSELRTAATPVDVVECVPDTAPFAVEEAIGKKVGPIVVVAPPLTASLLCRCVKVPVVVVDVDRAGISRAVASLRSTPGKIACVLFRDALSDITGTDLDDVSVVTGQCVVPFYLDELSEVTPLLRRLKGAGVAAVVTTCHTVAWSAEEMGFSVAVVRLHRGAVQRAIEQAELHVALEHERRRAARRLVAALNACPRPAALVGPGGHIVAVNRAAEEMLRINGSESQTAGWVLTSKGDECVAPGGKRVSIHKAVPVDGDSAREERIVVFGEVARAKAAANSGHGFVARYTFEDILGRSTQIRAALARARMFAQSDSPLLILGETGTGKELFAHATHLASWRRTGPFVAVNCRALPESLLESELFGYDPGTFTGGRREGKPGLFELADGGTLFLDEIGDLPASSQAALLRVLDHGHVRRVGGTRLVRTDVRVIAATNVDLVNAVEAGRYRRDLYFRLSSLALRLPPLRERVEDIPILAEAFLQENRERYGYDFPPFDGEALGMMLSHQWPGNVRELKSFVEQYCLAIRELSEEPASVVRALLGRSPSHQDGRGSGGLLRRIEREVIEELLRDRRYRKKDLARILGVSRTTLWKRMKELETELSAPT